MKYSYFECMGEYWTIKMIGVVCIRFTKHRDSISDSYQALLVLRNPLGDHHLNL